MIDADHTQWQLTGSAWQLHRDGRVGEGGVDFVDGNGIVRVRGIAGDIAHDAQLACRGRQGLGVDEGRDLGGEVDAVDEDIGFDDFLVRSWLRRGLGEIPFLRID